MSVSTRCIALHVVLFSDIFFDKNQEECSLELFQHLVTCSQMKGERGDGCVIGPCVPGQTVEKEMVRTRGSCRREHPVWQHLAFPVLLRSLAWARKCCHFFTNNPLCDHFPAPLPTGDLGSWEGNWHFSSFASQLLVEIRLRDIASLAPGVRVY